MSENPKFIEKPTEVKLRIPYILTKKMYDTLKKGAREGKKFIIMSINNPRLKEAKEDMIVCEINLELEW